MVDVSLVFCFPSDKYRSRTHPIQTAIEENSVVMFSNGDSYCSSLAKLLEADLPEVTYKVYEYVSLPLPLTTKLALSRVELT